MKDFSELKKNLKHNASDLKKIKVAILGDSSTQFLGQALQGTGFDNGFNLNIWEADFNQISRQVFDLTANLYEMKPEVVIVFQSTHKLLSKYNKLPPGEYSSLAIHELELIKDIYFTIAKELNPKIIFYNYYEINDAVFGNYSNKTESSFLFQLRKLNFDLMTFASENSNFHLCDISSIHNQVGRSGFFQSSIYINSEMVLSIEVLPYVAAKTLDIINALYGKAKKCLILDLDNTIWGGIIGDDGIENIQIGNLGIGKAFTEFQYWIKKLKNRGVIIAVCSKNTESIAKEPFEKHPDMVLQRDDIAIFIANWENKVDNIRLIQSILNIGFDSIVYLDDSYFERNIVRENIPEITVPELPEDPADYLEFLYDLNLFETVSFTGEDAERTKFYQLEGQRNNFHQKFTNEDKYLESLQMVSTVEAFNKFNIPRVAQLSQRSNQFNLRTVRYTEQDLTKLASDKDYFTFAFTLVDKFGDNGLICVVVLIKENAQILFIENWFMSCRVLKRGMENFVLSTIAGFAKKKGFALLKAAYIPTSKNEIVKDHYLNLGFEKAGDYWEFSLNNSDIKTSFIKENQHND